MGKVILDPRILLLQRAGITDELLEVGEVDQLFEKILEALGAIHRGKEALYGNYLETHGDEPTNFALVQHFCDLKRKFVRAENFVKKRLDGQNISLVEMLDTYSDMAVYGAMGVQLCLHLMTRGKDADSDRERSGDSTGGHSGGGTEGRASDHLSGRGGRATSIFAGVTGGGDAPAPGTPVSIPGRPSPSPDAPLGPVGNEVPPVADLKVSQESLGAIAERYRNRPLTPPVFQKRVR